MKRIIYIIALLCTVQYTYAFIDDTNNSVTGFLYDINKIGETFFGYKYNLSQDKWTAILSKSNDNEHDIDYGPGIGTRRKALTHLLVDYIENNNNILIIPDSALIDGCVYPVSDIKSYGNTQRNQDGDILCDRFPWNYVTHDFTVVFPKRLKSASGMFAYCEHVTAAEVNNRLETLGGGLFESTPLSTMSIIGKQKSKEGCIQLPARLKTIGVCAFENCRRIKEVICDTSLETIGKYAFAGCDSLKGFSFPSKILVISDYSFRGCKSLQAERLDLNNVTTIGKGAFRNCTSLNTIDFKNVVTIGNDAFDYCISLNNLDLKNVKTIGNSAFESCTSLSSLNLRNVSSIGNKGFYGCKNLSTIDLSKVDSIGKQCFEQCDTLQSVTLKKGIKIGSRAFYGCKNLNKIDLSRISYLGDSALAYCRRLDLKKLDLTGIDYVGRSAFLGNNIDEIYIPKTTQFGYRPFGGNEISKIIFEEGRDSIPNNFLGGAQITSDSIAIPEGITHLGQKALELDNSISNSLPTLVLPSTLKSLEAYLFGITYFWRYESWTWTDGQRIWVDHYKVYYDNPVSRIIILAETPPEFTGKFTVFDSEGAMSTGNGDQAKSPLGCQTDIPIYVPNGTIEAYKSAAGWNKYTNYHEMSELTGIGSVTIDDADQQGMDNGIYYDLQGRKVTNPQKGVYIHQGKKVMIK